MPIEGDLLGECGSWGRNLQGEIGGAAGRDMTGSDRR